MENGFEKDFAVVWPAPGIGDMQGGIVRTRMPAQNLNHFTATTGPAIVRGDALPADLKGDLLFTEPVGRLIRRAAIENIEGLTQLRNVYPGAEFINERRPALPAGEHQQRAGRHALHRRHVPRHHPGAAVVGPGIVPAREDRAVSAGQGRVATAASGACATTAAPRCPRPTTNIGQPAIPAIQPKFAPPRMYSETPAQLVAHFAHPNGWWRDMAQRLLVLKQDKSVVPALQQMVRSSDNLLARFHAMWTLEGLGALDASARARGHEGHESADARAGDSRERDAVQGRRQVVRRRLPRADEGRRPERRHPGDADGESLQAAGCGRRDQGGAGREQGEGGRARSASACSRLPAHELRRRPAAARSRRTRRSGCSRAATCSAPSASPVMRPDGLGEGHGRRACRDDDGAAAGRLAARAGASRLRDQGAARRA